MLSITHNSSDAPASLRIDGSLTIYEVAQARDELLALLPLDYPEWLIDLGGVVELDSAGAQFLLAVQRVLSCNGSVPQVINLPDESMDLIELLRLQTLYPAPAPVEG